MTCSVELVALPILDLFSETALTGAKSNAFGSQLETAVGQDSKISESSGDP